MLYPPGTLKALPQDFIDGHSLHYRVAAPDAFVLYSIGLDGVDDGGQVSLTESSSPPYRTRDPFDSPDILWPRAASDAEAGLVQSTKARKKEEERKRWQQEVKEHELEQEQQRRATIARLDRIYLSGGLVKVVDKEYDGKMLSAVLRNPRLPGLPLSLNEMLTLRQVITGKEPELATFELPISYDVIRQIGNLSLLCDADPSEEYGGDVETRELQRATNGNCRITWNTTYEAPGKHFLQACLWIRPPEGRGKRRNPDYEEMILKGPLFKFVSTNVIQILPMDSFFTQKGAWFRAKLAQSIGSYTLKISSPSGEPIHSISGSTTNGRVELMWDLTCEGGKRYTNESFLSEWDVKFPDKPQ